MRLAAPFVVSLMLAGNGCECAGDERGESGAPARTEPSAAVTPQARCVERMGPVDDRYAPIVRAACAEQHGLGIPAVAVAVAEDSKLRLAVGFGSRCRERPGEVDASTPFRIGSLTKMFTAATAVALDEAGTVSLDTPIGELVSQLQAASPELAGLPLHRFLNHTAGLRDVMPTVATAALDEDALVRLWAQGAIAPDPTAFSYANTGYYLAGLALQHATGQPLPALVQRHVLQPHDIEASFDAAAVRNSAACGHLRVGGRDEVLDVVEDFERHAHGAKWTLPAGGIIADAPALVGFALGPGSKTLADRAAATAVPTGDGDRYALGVHVRTLDDGRTVLFHRGSTGDFNAELHWIPTSGFAVAVLSNSGAPMRATVHAALALADAEPPAR